MRPKGKLFALLAVFAAIGLVTATGAFTTVTAERTADVSVAGDSSALLALEAHGNSENAGNDGYAYQTDGTLTLNLAGSGQGSEPSGSGVNYDAVTEIELVFNITNQGTQPVDVWINKTDDSDDQSQAVEFYNGTSNAPFNSRIDGSSNSSTVSTGETVQISIKIDTTGLTKGDINDGDLLDSVTIHAEAS